MVATEGAIEIACPIVLHGWVDRRQVFAPLSSSPVVPLTYSVAEPVAGVTAARSSWWWLAESWRAWGTNGAGAASAVPVNASDAPTTPTATVMRVCTALSYEMKFWSGSLKSCPSKRPSPQRPSNLPNPRAERARRAADPQLLSSLPERADVRGRPPWQPTAVAQ